MRKKLLTLIVLVAAGLLLFILAQKNRTTDLKQDAPLITSLSSPNAPTQSESQKLPQVPTAPPEGTPVSATFQKWFATEVSTLEKSTKDPKAKELELRELVFNMRPEEIQFLTQQSLKMEGPANQRILATYLLSLAPQKTSAALLTVMEAPMQITAENEAHSTDETLSAQEHSLRRLAIDALIEKARQDPAFKAELAGRVPRIENVALRDYAKRRIRELN